MKYLLVVMMTVLVSACAHKHHGDMGADSGCNKTAEENKNCGCAMQKKDDKKHECANCEGKNTYDHHHHGEAMSALMGPKVTQQISNEEFTKLYTQNKEKLGKTCNNPAMTYCGKTTKDMMVSEAEASCLWTKVFRVTRETLPELDGSACAKMIKGFAKK